MGNGERRKKGEPFGERMTFYGSRRCVGLARRRVPSVARHVYSTSSMAQAETLDQVKFPLKHVPIHLPYP
jgi:hypothetical protein